MSIIFDTIGRRRTSCNLGAIWTTAEIELLYSCQLDLTRSQAAAKYLLEARKLDYPTRTETSIHSRLDRYCRHNKTKFRWAKAEDNCLIELFQEYPFEIAFKKYQGLVAARNYPTRNKNSVYSRLSRLGISVLDPVLVAGINSIARSLGLSSQTIAKFLRKSKISTKKVGQKVVCNVNVFYRWFVRSGSWAECLRGCATIDNKPDLDSWVVLLRLPLSEVEREWQDARNSILRVRSPMSFTPMRISEFARQHHITAGGIRSAIRQGRSDVAGVSFEVCKL